MLGSLLRNRISVVWFLLIAATLLSLSVGTGHGLDSHRGASVAVLLVAFVKVFLVGMYFMELRAAQNVLRGLFAGYCLLVYALCTGMFRFA